MKRFITLSLAVCLLSLRAIACIYEPVTNYYVFRLSSLESEIPWRQMATRYWADYTGSTDNGDIFGLNYDSNSPIWQAALHKMDDEMLAYLKALQAYPGFVEQKDQWEYPTKAELQQQKNAFATTLQVATAYKGQRLRSQYLYLAMRAAFGLKLYDKVDSLWTQRPSMPQDHCYLLAENLYAGVLYKQGKIDEALNLYATHKDWNSVRWIMPKRRNVAGIEQVAQQDPNSPVLPLLIQEFVNDMQETYDSYNYNDMHAWQEPESEDAYYAEWRREREEAMRIAKQEIEDFVTMTDQIVAKKRVKSPALWQAAAAMLRYYQGQRAEAYKRATKATNYGGAEPYCTNARIVKLFTSTAIAQNTASYRKYLLHELRWLWSKTHGTPAEVNDYYANMRTRLVYQELNSLFNRWGKAYNSVALLHPESNLLRRDRSIYGSDFVARLDSLSADSVVQFTRWLKASGKDDLEVWIKSNAYSYAQHQDFYNDYIGTRLMSEGRFSEAIPYLEKVPLRFLNTQKIAAYASQRHYEIEPWITATFMVQSDPKGKVKSNQKLEYCRDVIALTKALKTAKGNDLDRKRYQLATYLFQAAPMGQCWYLARYYVSPLFGYEYEEYTDLPKREYAFSEKARELLLQVAKSKNAELRTKALFALAYLPDPGKHEKYLTKEAGTGEQIFIDTAPQAEYFQKIYQSGDAQKLPYYVSECYYYRVYVSSQEKPN